MRRITGYRDSKDKPCRVAHVAGFHCLPLYVFIIPGPHPALRSGLNTSQWTSTGTIPSEGLSLMWAMQHHRSFSWHVSKCRNTWVDTSKLFKGCLPVGQLHRKLSFLLHIHSVIQCFPQGLKILGSLLQFVWLIMLVLSSPIGSIYLLHFLIHFHVVYIKYVNKTI